MHLDISKIVYTQVNFVQSDESQHVDVDQAAKAVCLQPRVV